jgi:hypothetical protein
MSFLSSNVDYAVVLLVSSPSTKHRNIKGLLIYEENAKKSLPCSGGDLKSVTPVHLGQTSIN